ncbi:uncharacterized protein KRP23_9426 [Phytophthora ramorum]|uniref:uncharacterized protein n=1 Tax=Phytophthora ramorum TaxID=164328 RepID=UPI0030A35CE8|nr:hypothetical protein KRP23_9426 [Phytophthora ramorum]
MSKQSSPSPVLTPQLTPSVTDYGITKLWDERPAKYAKHVLKNVCIILFILSAFSQVTNFAIAQSLKNFFQKLGWSNKGSTSMKLTFDSLCQFMCIIAGYISDERLGKFKTLLSAATLDCFGLLLLVVAALPTVLSHFSPAAPATEKSLFFSIQYAVANVGAFIGYAAFPYVSIHGMGAIPADYGYVSVYIAGFAMVLLFLGLLWISRQRYVNVPPTRESIALVIKIMTTHAKKNFNAKMITLGTILYVAAFALNILASFLSDHGEVGHNISYACGVMIVVATFLWIYFGCTSTFMEGAKDTVSGQFDGDLVDESAR